MQVIVAPDSFKGSLSAVEVCQIVGDELRQVGAEVRLVPVADGGEGTVEALALATSGTRVIDQVSGPYGDTVSATRLTLPNGQAVVELAQAAGLVLAGPQLQVGAASTYGVGQQLLAAAEGAAEIVVAIGGSATNDGGCGAAAACGVRFLDSDGAQFVPTGSTLHRIFAIEMHQFAPQLQDKPITAMCDVDNPLTGSNGAAYVFAPQKGADAATVERLDEGLRHLAQLIRRDLGIDVEHLPGAGAAGGMGAGLVAFFGAKLQSGIDVVLNAVGFDELLLTADAVITGEGSFDAQSLRGKVIDGVARRAAAARVPVHVLAGRVAADMAGPAAELGIVSAAAITPSGMPLAEAMPRAQEYLGAAARQLAARLATVPRS